MNKQAEKLLSIWWFFVLGVIAGGIVIGVLIYSSAEVSIKEAEANVLAERITDCLIDNGYLKEKILERDFDILDFCNLNSKVFEKSSNFYFNISVYDSENLIFNVSKGNPTFEKDCRIGMSEDIKAEHFPRCFEKQELVLFKDKNAKLIILAASNQNGRKISVA